MTENTFQSQLFFAFTRYELGRPDLFMFAVPNGDLRDPVVANRLKATGVRRGVSDLIVMGGGKVVYVECKTDTGKLSDHQERFKQKATLNKMAFITARPADGVAAVCEKIIKLLYS